MKPRRRILAREASSPCAYGQPTPMTPLSGDFSRGTGRVRLSDLSGLRGRLLLRNREKTPTFATPDRAMHHLESNCAFVECKSPNSYHQASLLRALRVRNTPAPYLALPSCSQSRPKQHVPPKPSVDSPVEASPDFLGDCGRGMGLWDAEKHQQMRTRLDQQSKTGLHHEVFRAHVPNESDAPCSLRRESHFFSAK